MQFTKVLNLSTNEELLYSLPPRQAVVAAFEQKIRHNYNIFTYDYSKAKISQSGKTVSCGDFCAIMPNKVCKL